MNETGMQNPIFNLASNFGNPNNFNQGMNNPMMNNGMNQSGMNNFPMMNNGMNQSGMNNYPMVNNGMNQMGMNNNQMMNNGMNQMGMNNPMMNSGMMNMNNMNMMQAAANMNMMNNNNLQNMNDMNMGSNSSTPMSNQFINVDFMMGSDGENGKIMIQCSMDDKIQDLIDKFKTKTMEDVSKKKFVFNARALIPTKTVRDSELFNGAKIFVIETKGVKGA